MIQDYVKQYCIQMKLLVSCALTAETHQRYICPDWAMNLVWLDLRKISTWLFALHQNLATTVHILRQPKVTAHTSHTFCE